MTCILKGGHLHPCAEESAHVHSSTAPVHPAVQHFTTYRMWRNGHGGSCVYVLMGTAAQPDILHHRNIPTHSPHHPHRHTGLKEKLAINLYHPGRMLNKLAASRAAPSGVGNVSNAAVRSQLYPISRLKGKTAQPKWHSLKHRSQC